MQVTCRFLLALAIGGGIIFPACSQDAAQLLPNAEQTFVDHNGRPLAAGSVYFYVPNTTTLKDTWKDKDKNVLNTNPVVLDAAGRAIIYGDGHYSQKVLDVHGNLIWNQLTQTPDVGGGGTGTVTSITGDQGIFTEPSPIVETGVVKCYISTPSQLGCARPDNVTITASSGIYTALLPVGANPTAIASNVAVNGVATTFMRSDAAPAIQLITDAQFGIAKVDNVTITASGGVISAVSAGGACGTAGVDGQVCNSLGGASSGWGSRVIGAPGATDTDGDTVEIAGGAGDGIGNGGPITLTGGLGGLSDGNGGSITITGGMGQTASGVGGNVTISGGDEATSDGSGGTLTLLGGAGGGRIVGQAGGGNSDGTDGTAGGDVTWDAGRGGDGGGAGSPGGGGDFTITGGAAGTLLSGTSGAAGGQLQLLGGPASDYGTGGLVTILGGSAGTNGTSGAVHISTLDAPSGGETSSVLLAGGDGDSSGSGNGGSIGLQGGNAVGGSGVPGDVNIYTGVPGGANKSGVIALRGHVAPIANGTPAVSSCGTSPTIRSSSSDTSGLVTIGTGTVTACTLTFAYPFDRGSTPSPEAPVCMAIVYGSAIAASISASSTTAVTISFASDVAGAKVGYHCLGI